MKEFSKKRTQEVIDVLDRHIEKREDLGFDMAAGCSQYLKDALRHEESDAS